MKPNELYQRKPERTTHELYSVIGGWEPHIAEIDECDFYYDKCQEEERIEIKFYKDFCFDGRRTWTLGSIWFEGKPLMVFRNAGREGIDHYSRFITNQELYHDMVAYLRSFCIDQDLEVYDPDEDIEDLESFYGNTLDGEFKRY